MLKKIGLALLIPCMGGCIWHDGHSRGHRRDSRPAGVAHVEHVHGHGCGHAFRGGIWITVQ